MDQHRQTQLACCLPNGNQARIVHFDQMPLMIFDVQPKRLPDLQALRARLVLDSQPARRPLGESIAQALPLRPIHAAEDLEALWRPLFEVFQVCVEDIFPPSAIEVDVMRNACFIQKIEQLAERFFVPATAKGIGKVVMRIDTGELRLFDECVLGHELGLRTKVFEKHQIHHPDSA